MVVSFLAAHSRSTGLYTYYGPSTFNAHLPKRRENNTTYNFFFEATHACVTTLGESITDHLIEELDMYECGYRGPPGAIN